MQIKVKTITCGNIFINQAGADVRARNASVLGKLVQNRFGGVYRDGKTIAIGEEKMPDSPSPAEKEQVLAKETERLINAIPASAYVVLLDLQGREITSPQLAELFDGWALADKSHIAFVIGGAFGYTDALRRRADMRWSFSKLTFTHQMIRLLLVEQIYRAFKISRGEKYHW